MTKTASLPTLPGGATIALAAEQASLDDGADTLLWKGIQTFAGTYGYTAEKPHCRRYLGGGGRSRPA